MYNRQLHNKTYYEKKENIKRKQREKRQKMKEALQQVEAENQETENEPEPEPVSTKLLLLIISDIVQSILLKSAISGSLVASQAIYRALKKTIENRQSTTQSSPVISSNPLD